MWKEEGKRNLTHHTAVYSKLPGGLKYGPRAFPILPNVPIRNTATGPIPRSKEQDLRPVEPTEAMRGVSYPKAKKKMTTTCLYGSMQGDPCLILGCIYPAKKEADRENPFKMQILFLFPFIHIVVVVDWAESKARNDSLILMRAMDLVSSSLPMSSSSGSCRTHQNP